MSADEQTIKLADVTSNISTIVQYDPGFDLHCLSEKEALLPFLTKGDAKLRQRALDTLTAARESLASPQAKP